MVIGLLGGSFDPAHAGHVHITRQAIRRFGLDRVWWLVSPGNPLKARGPRPMPERLAHARCVMDDPRVEVTDLEARLGTRHTADTLRALMRRYPGVTFVWLMGADNLAQLHRWDDWRWIMTHVRVGVLARPGWGVRGRAGPAARSFAGAQVGARALVGANVPAWAFADLPMSGDSSTAIRARGDWG
ncbi:nicotinate-nucleotide adenylyltransferase [Falsirhodobacter halotolerans]|uniref:nicotinate-nucleotide adenylyltransferase n=1 Tax=Falsirhodobacter halotolerans TaxID=1146892 RepID=UPI001FD08E87|nr:nicotinate-nucleotide adenylyltransferase [Falsirhodobacter halotolerans]